MHEDVFILEQKFQPYLLNNDYTFVGPVDEDLLDNFIHLFSKLQYGLAIILSFIGIKMIISPFYHIESLYSLLVIGGILALSVIVSILMPEPAEA